MAGLVEVTGDESEGSGGAGAAAPDGAAADAGSGTDTGAVADDEAPADPPSGGGDRPDFIPEEAWNPDTGYDKAKHLELLRAETRPEAADAYELPDIDGFDKETAASSPLVAALRTSAHAAGLDQAGFESAVRSYVEESVRLSTEAAAAAQAELGENHAARTAAIGRFLGSNLPKDEASALAAGLTSAKAVIAMEKIMNRGARKADSAPPPPSRASRAEIESLMNSKAYMGKANERDPAVIAKVDEWFRAEAAAKK